MRKQWKRLLIAASLSGLGFLITYTWYATTNKKLVIQGAIPVAQVAQVGDEVLRRPTTRLLWHQVNTGDQLYSGEAIRTSQKGEVRIQFEDGKFIDLESDSLIVLQKSQGEVALDLMEGSLFVNAKSEGGDTKSASNIVLNSASGKVQLNGANASLSKSNGGKVDLQVLEGKATIQGKDGQQKELKEGAVGALGAQGLQVQNIDWQIISPKTSGRLLVDPDVEKPITFQWKGIPKEWQVVVMSGQNRRELHERDKSTAPSDKIQTQMPIGKQFWKLVAKDPATQKVLAETPVYKMDVATRTAPTMLFPTANAMIEYDTPNYALGFKWQKSEDTKQVVIELAKDAALKNKVLTKAFNAEDAFETPQLADGNYFWRIVAYYNDDPKPFIGRVQKFTLSRKAVSKRAPMESQWDLNRSSEVQYFVDKPAVDLAWLIKTRNDEVAGYKVVLNSEDGGDETRQTFESHNAQMKVPVEKPGRYIASVHVFNKDGEKIGEVAQRTIAVNELPLLPAPKILADGPTIKSNDDGKVQVKWQEIKGADAYQLIISDSTGKVVLDKKMKSASTTITNMPGQYKIQVAAVDTHGRVGEKDEGKTLVVPEKSALKAPTLKGIRVK